MYRTVRDFLNDWATSAKGTEMVLEALTDEKLDQAIVPGHNTLGWIGWHLTTAISFFAGQSGLIVRIDGDKDTVPVKAADILAKYKKASLDLMREVEEKLTDDKVQEEVDSYSGRTPRGAILRTLIDHQTHHRGQMTVLLRQAGLPVPGVMGPTKEQQQ